MRGVFYNSSDCACCRNLRDDVILHFDLAEKKTKIVQAWAQTSCGDDYTDMRVSGSWIYAESEDYRNYKTWITFKQQQIDYYYMNVLKMMIANTSVEENPVKVDG